MLALTVMIALVGWIAWTIDTLRKAPRLMPCAKGRPRLVDHRAAAHPSSMAAIRSQPTGLAPESMYGVDGALGVAGARVPGTVHTYRSMTRVSKRATQALACGAVMLLGLLVTPGVGSASTIQLDSITPADAVEGVPIQLTVSGLADAAGSMKWLVVKYKPASSGGCASTSILDPGMSVYEQAPSGAYVRTVSFTIPAPGSFQVCAWIGMTGQTPHPNVSRVVEVRAAKTSLALKTTGESVPGERFPLQVAAAAEVRRLLFVKQKPAGGLGCAPTFASDSGVAVVTGTVVEGSLPEQSVSVRLKELRPYIFCAWLQKDGKDATPQTAAEISVTPLPRLTSAISMAPRRSGKFVSLRGRVANADAGPVIVEYRRGPKVRVLRRTRVQRDGTWSVAVKVVRPLVVRARFAGVRSTAPSVSRWIAIRPPRRTS
ncbi:MAG TPA: hypothetical protein PKB03_00460 [Baekduia sp.]|nr:hypothetical protein [Baekduia sp.]